METLLLFATVLLAVAIFAVAGFWFFRESKEREQRRKQTLPTRATKPARGPTRTPLPAWDGGIKTSPRHLR
jgi:hypothetical protein